MANALSQAPLSFGTFSAAGGPQFAGIVRDGQVLALTALLPWADKFALKLRGAESMLSFLAHWDDNYSAAKSILAEYDASRAKAAHPLPFTPAELLSAHAPLMPDNIFCAGANYKKHVIDLIVAQGGEPGSEAYSTAEQRRAYGQAMMDKRAREGKPFVLVKTRSAVTGPYDPIIVPKDAKQPDWEVELGVVIGKKARRISRAEAMNYVAGYLVVNDITTRELVYRPDVPMMGMDWLSSKCSPSFFPIGPSLVPAEFIKDPHDLTITFMLNGQRMVHEQTNDMIFNIPRLIEYISQTVEMQPGDILATGSPPGNGMHYSRFLRPGDIAEGGITLLGNQRNHCIAEE